MEVLSKQPSVKGPAEMFTGDLVGHVPVRRLHDLLIAGGSHDALILFASWNSVAPTPKPEGPETEWGEHVGDAEYPNPA